MGVFAGPHDTSTGLTFCLDAASPKSYPGSGSTWTDVVGANNCTLVNSPTYSTANNGYFSFDGTTQRGYCSGTPLNTTNYTKSFWFYITSYVVNNLVSGWDGFGGHFMYMASGNKIYSGHSDWASYSAYPSTATFDLNTWYYVSLTFNISAGFVLYVNGYQDSTYTALKTAATSGYVEIASYSASNLLSGRMAHISLYNRTLSASEVAQNFYSLRGRFGV